MFNNNLGKLKFATLKSYVLALLDNDIMTTSNYLSVWKIYRPKPGP